MYIHYIMVLCDLHSKDSSNIIAGGWGGGGGDLAGGGGRRGGYAHQKIRVWD